MWELVGCLEHFLPASLHEKMTDPCWKATVTAPGHCDKRYPGLSVEKNSDGIDNIESFIAKLKPSNTKLGIGACFIYAISCD